MKKKYWFKLDNAAKIYPPISNENRGSMFSLSAILKENIDGEILNQAVNVILDRFPTFKVRLKRGIFWYYLEENKKSFNVCEEPAYFLRFVNESENNNYLFRVFYYNKKITISIFHALTDGTGGMEFFKAIVFEYLILKGYKLKSEGSLKTINSPSTLAENEDHFLKAFDKRISKPPKEKKAFHIIGTAFSSDGIGITTGTVKVDSIKALAKKYNVTITTYICGLLMYCIYDAYIKGKKINNKLVKILIPVNMRKFYNTKTIRNFALFTRTNHDFADAISLDECIKICAEQLKTGLAKENLDKLIHSNVKIEKNWLLKIMPLFIKDLAMKIAYNFVGDALHTTTISNLGKVDMPKATIPYIDNFLFALGTSYSSRAAMSIVTFENKLNITFSRTIIENEHEKLFFRTLTENGVEVELASNYWEARV